MAEHKYEVDVIHGPTSKKLGTVTYEFEHEIREFEEKLTFSILEELEFEIRKLS